MVTTRSADDHVRRTADGFVRRRSRVQSGLRRRFALLYGAVIVLVAASFLWQMVHGICPVP